MTAKEYIYFEHQYPFQNGALTYYMCEALRRNPKLLVREREEGKRCREEGERGREETKRE